MIREGRLKRDLIYCYTSQIKEYYWNENELFFLYFENLCFLVPSVKKTAFLATECNLNDFNITLYYL